MFLTQAGTIDFIGIKPIKGRYFRCKYGVFILDLRRAVDFYGTKLFVYDSKIGYPLSVEACKRIQTHLSDNNKFSLIRDVVAINHREYTRELGKTTMKFLGDIMRTDLATVLNLMNNALQSDKKMPISMSLASILDSINIVNMAARQQNFAFVFVDNISLKIVPLELMRAGNRLIGQCRYGTLDLTFKRNKYTYGKIAVYVATLDTQPKDLNDYVIQSTDFTNEEGVKEEIEIAPQEQETTEQFVPVPEVVVSTQGEEEQVPNMEISNPIAATLPEEDFVVVTEESDFRKPAIIKRPEPRPRQEIIAKSEVMRKMNEIIVQPEKPKKGFRSGGNGNGKGRKSDMDLPANIEPSDMGIPINLNMESMVTQFKNYDPSIMEEVYLEGKYAKRTIDSVSPPPKKKSFNIWFAVGIVIIGIVVFQAIINPQIAKIQRGQEAAQDKQPTPAPAPALTPPPAANPPTQTGGSQLHEQPPANPPSTGRSCATGFQPDANGICVAK